MCLFGSVCCYSLEALSNLRFIKRSTLVKDPHVKSVPFLLLFAFSSLFPTTHNPSALIPNFAYFLPITNMFLSEPIGSQHDENFLPVIGSMNDVFTLNKRILSLLFLLQQSVRTRPAEVMPVLNVAFV
jgi:hypothetical protein